MRLQAVGDAWSPEDAVRAVGEARWVHVGALLRTDFPRETLAALAEPGRALLVDGQGLLRTSALGALRSNREIGDILRFVTMLKLDEAEAEMLAGSASPELLRSLGVPEVIVTLGAHGSMIITRDGCDSVPAIEVGAAVDPTGAGDTFSAAYLVSRVSGAEPVEAARAGTRAASELLAERRP
jgi:sugar/nucleoside kinase (ribokinase family)